MALRTNSKIVRNRIREYIKDCYEAWAQDDGTFLSDISFPQMSHNIMTDFDEWCVGRKPTYNMQEYFEEWLQGLPSCNLGDFYMRRNNDDAIKILGDILEETEEERNKFSYDQAEHLLTSLIYSELLKGRKEHDKNCG